MTLVRAIVDVDNMELNVWALPHEYWRWVPGDLVLECTAERNTMFGRWAPVRTFGGTIYVRRLGGAPFPLREEEYRLLSGVAGG